MPAFLSPIVLPLTSPRTSRRTSPPRPPGTSRHARQVRLSASPGRTGPAPQEGAPGWRELEQSWRFDHRHELYAGDAGSQRDSLDCPDCRATGVVECKFCGSTGMLTLGDKLLCSVTGSTTCPVCEGSGDCRCQKCGGCGQIAKWILP